MKSSIPVIDFSHFLTGSSNEQQIIADQFDSALQSRGFIYLENHGIDQVKIDECFEWSRRFFKLPLQEKESLQPTPQSFDQGYFGLEHEKIRGQTCVKESYDFGNTGLWPADDRLPGFREFAMEFHQICTTLMDKLLACISLALHLNIEDSLRQYHNGSLFVSSLLHYPAISVPRPQVHEVIRNPAHADLGTLTILFQHNVGGLQIADMNTKDTGSQSFIDVYPKPGTVIVNLGYLLMRWTNRRWLSTIHRVVEPPQSIAAIEDDDSGVLIPERYSIAFFGFPDAATMVEPLPTCCDTPAKWSSLNAGDYLLRKRRVLYQ